MSTQLTQEQGEAPPVLVLPIDQGEELFITEGAKEAEALLAIMRHLLMDDAPSVLALITMRSDSYDRLQSAKALEGITQATLSLPPMPRGAYQEVIEGPLARLRDTPRALTIEPALTQALLADINWAGDGTRCRCWPSRWSACLSNMAGAGDRRSLTMRRSGA